MRDIRTILTSNIPGGGEDCLYVDYDRYTNADEMISDNAGLMLLKLLIRCRAESVYLAGFDGFHHRYNGNYYRRELNLKVNEEEILEKQIRIRKQLAELSKAIHIHFLNAFRIRIKKAYEYPQKREGRLHPSIGLLFIKLKGAFCISSNRVAKRAFL